MAIISVILTLEGWQGADQKEGRMGKRKYRTLDSVLAALKDGRLKPDDYLPTYGGPEPECTEYRVLSWDCKRAIVMSGPDCIAMVPRSIIEGDDAQEGFLDNYYVVTDSLFPSDAEVIRACTPYQAALLYIGEDLEPMERDFELEVVQIDEQTGAEYIDTVEVFFFTADPA